MRHFVCSAAILVGAAASAQDASVKVDPDLRSYRKIDPVAGTLQSVGSDTLNVLMNHWAAAVSKEHPGFRVLVEGKGSNTAPLALTNGASQFGPMSREIRPREADVFTAKHGHAPTGLRVALDALAVFVHKDNPIEEISLDDLDAVWSRDRKRGGKVDVATWGQLGLAGEWSARKIRLVGRTPLSGTHSFFKERVLRDGVFKETVVAHSTSAAVAEDLARDPASLGYGSAASATPGIKKLRISCRRGEEAVPPDAAHVYDESYPLYRTLYLYVTCPPDRSMDPAVREFCRYALSREGQSEVVKDGFYPLPAWAAVEELGKLK